jgi:hypothetical protein
MDRLLDYFTNHPILAGGLVLMTIIVVAYEMRRQGQGSTAVAPNDAIRMMNEGAVLVDVRPVD